MRHFIAPLLVAITLALPAAAQADCFVEYKAKKDSPLRLHYGILSLDGSCPSASAAAQSASRRVASGGWTLLNVVGLSENTPSGAKRANAGEYYLRY
ncbi:hypothetical protein J7443_03720 [Tropicibacter sp. R15_0]|uniref:hypothetical protein n=1 Tax=Roseobacteraceae TaxID=2854170 RepID=UPI000C06B38D|nr:MULTISPECIES: hypothetical protein [Roseobacteraceae]MBO9464327.1 hypothetical protein [Tropicibacter sp. R15_0]TDS94769.1 hypothetical protein CLV87_1284 [Pelagimonas phthalicica]